jgi:pimeloyl-ACP methyl ester carboxylesterase
VLAPDLAGFGGSDDHDDERVSLDDYARDVLAALDVLGVERAVVGGVSLGGYVALAVARLAPERLAGLILADTRAGADTPAGREGRDRMLDVVRDSGSAGVADAMMDKLLGETTRRERPDLVARTRALVLANRPDTLRRATLRLRDRPDATPALGGLTVPALVLVGDEDTVTPRAEADVLASGIPHASLTVVPRAGHLAALEQPEAFNAAVAAFLRPLARDPRKDT